ncbi:hypothetical protein ACFSCV_14130 [Methylopila henanensis]|uniref:Uncharacterized protein n=1 Tax=Methylopila henanensis TaxID=873516 RepID=A0ABW4KA58_9HYPH
MDALLTVAELPTVKLLTRTDGPNHWRDDAFVPFLIVGVPIIIYLVWFQFFRRG